MPKAGGRGRRELTIEKLWEQFLKTREVELRNKLVVHYTPLVHTHAARLSRKLPAQVSYDEICSAAFDGLIEAVEAYDPTRKAKFETFCQQRISGAVMDWLRSLDPQSRTVRTFEKRRMLARELLGVEAEGAPAQVEVARRLNMSVDRYDYLSRLSQLGKEVHFSAMEPPDERRPQGSSHSWDIRDQASEDPSRQVSRELLTEYLTRGLTREERLVLVLYYFEQMTMAEIGAVLNLSESRVSQIHKEILLRLRQRLGPTLCEELVA
ncbi:MAG TPA: sigma-70 family RNA polymerase sigma factor [Phycisphaerae bacterium]|nr:sigma-70 family RNA polymerase sigma factor [Phycisphaerae bacterium]HNU46716.1 sigma-70 family RNA polymerase sigma factor [Phycisphaerae bacterium]